ncbi:MAG: hypothetical protein J7K00_01215 [Candidatus Diapherotrites archaeon]|nr:hypothetical protein [Candidatus Diapherotrites archaeon]
MFDCSYSEHSGGGGRSAGSVATRQQTVVYSKINGSLPSFTLERENFFHKAAGLIGFNDIDFGTNPGFQKSIS